jgi:hypothetical protein
MTRWLWRKWDEVEMRVLIEGRIPAVDHIGIVAVSVGLLVQLLIAAGFLYGWKVPPYLFFMLFGVVLVGALAIVITQPRPWALEQGKPRETGASSGSEKLARGLWRLISRLLVSFGCAGAMWEGFAWLGERYFDDSIFGFRPSDVPGSAVGLVAAAVALVFWTLGWLWLPAARDRRSRTR